LLETIGSSSYPGHEGHTCGGTRPRANHTSTVEMAVPTPDTLPSTTDMGGLSKDEVEALCRLMSRLDTPATTSSSFTLTGNLATALNASVSIGHTYYYILLLRSYR